MVIFPMVPLFRFVWTENQQDSIAHKRMEKTNKTRF